MGVSSSEIHRTNWYVVDFPASHDWLPKASYTYVYLFIYLFVYLFNLHMYIYICVCVYVYIYSYTHLYAGGLVGGFNHGFFQTYLGVIPTDKYTHAVEATGLHIYKLHSVKQQQ